MGEDLTSSANQQSLPPELVPEPKPLNGGEELSFALPVDEQGHPLPYNALIDGADTKAQLGVELPVVMHINAAGKELVVVDLRSKDRGPSSGGRHVDTYGIDANGRTTTEKRTTRWDADFLVIGKEWNGGGMYRRGDKGFLGIRPPAATSGQNATDIVFGAGDGKCRDRFKLPAGMPQDAFHISYDGTSLKVTATEPITVTRMVEKAADAVQLESVERQAYEISAPEEAIMTESVSSAPGPEENHHEQVTIEAGPVILDEDLGDAPVPQQVESEQTSASEVTVEPEPAPEVHRPSASEIFESPDTFANALADEQLDPELRNQLHDLQSAWREVHVALEGNELWDGRVSSALTEAADVLAVMKRQGNDIQEAITELRSNLSSLADALGAWYQSMGSMDRHTMAAAADRAISILRNANISGVFDHVKSEGRKLSEQGLDVVVGKLNWEAIEADERYRDMHRYDGSMAAWPTEQMVQQVGSMLREGASLQALTDDFSRQGWDLSGTWIRRRDALELLARLNHRAQSAAWIEADSAYNTWQEIDANRRRGSLPSPEQLENVRLRLHLPLEEVELFNSLARLAETETEDTRARA